MSIQKKHILFCVKMLKIHDVLYYVLIVINLKIYRSSGLVFDLKEIKNNFFLTNEFNSTQNTSDFYQKLKQNDVNCLIEMNAIQSGLKTKELWAMTSK